MAKKMLASYIVYFTLFSWITADENTRFKVISDGNPAILNCTFSEYAATIKIVTVDFNSTVCIDSDDDILQEVSNVCNSKVKCELELADLIKDHNSTCSSNESTARLGITYHCSQPFTMEYMEGDRAMLTCPDEYNETIQISSVLYNYSTCSHSDKYGLQNMCDDHTACSFDVTNSNIGSICGADGKASLQVSYNCKRNGGWSDWIMKSDCSVTCGGGTQSYARSCTNPSPNEIGTSCVGESNYEEVCNANNCFYDDEACLNTQLNWTCPGGYIKVHSATWKTVTKCGRTFQIFESHNVVLHMQNKCNNKTTCVFTVEDSSFGVSCSENCSQLNYDYECVKAPWNSWKQWSNCSGSCVTGIQTRTRTCNSGFATVECEGPKTETRDCDEKDCYYCGDQKFYDRQNASLQLKTDSSNGTGYLLLDPVNTVHCCGQIAMWHYVPVNTGNITFSVWRKMDVNTYKVVGTNIVVVKDTDDHNQTTYNVPDNERILINTGDIIGWHDGGQNIIGYYDCLPSNKPCPTTTLRNSMGSTNVGEEINVESLSVQSSIIYTMSYTSTVKGPPQFGMTPDNVTIGYGKSVNSRVMDVQITDFGDFIQTMKLDYDNEYYYFDTRLRSIFVKKTLPHSTGQKITRHNYVLSVQDWCYNTATLNVTVTENIPPMIHDLSEMLRINPININPNLTTFTVDDPSDHVTCMINKTSPHTDMFILFLHGNDAYLMLSENSSIDVNTTSEYEIRISCTDGTDTTFFDLTLLFTTRDPAPTDNPAPTGNPAVTDKPDTQSDTMPIIIGASIGGLFLIVIIVIIIVVCVGKRQHKNNDENNVYEKPLQLSDIDGSSDGATPNQYYRGEEVDAIPHDNSGYVDVDLAKLKVRHVENQPTSEGSEYQTAWR